MLREALAAYDAGEPDRDFEIFKMKPEPGYPGIPYFDDPRTFRTGWIRVA